MMRAGEECRMLGQLIAAAADVFGVAGDEVLGDSRVRHIAAARHAVAYALRQRYPLLSLTGIGRMLGRDHTTIMYALAAAERRAVADREYALRLSALFLDT